MSQSKQSRVVRTATRTVIESLEGRQLMSVTTVPGTSGHDDFALTNLKAGDTIIYDGKGGHDTLHVYTSGNADTILGQIKLKNTSGGSFDLILENSVNADKAVKVGKGNITGLFAGSIDYSQTKLAGLDVMAKSKTASVLQLYDTAANTDTYFNLDGKWEVGLGYDTGKLDTLQGFLTLKTYPNSGSTLKINDVNDTAAHSNVQFFGDSLSGMSPKTMSFFNFDAVAITAGSGAKTVNIGRTLVPTEFTSFNGHDTFNVGYQGTLKYIAPGLKIGNMFGTATLNIDDSANTAVGSYVVNPTNVAFNGGDINYSATTSLNLSTGKGNDVVFVNSTNANPFSLKTGAGKDNVTILRAGNTAKVDTGIDTDTFTNSSASNGNLSLFGKGLTIANAEYITLSDQTQTTGHHYAVSPTGLTRDYKQLVNFTSATQLSVLAGTGNDVIDAFASTKIAQLDLTGGAGDDLLYGHNGADRLDGQAGNDTLIGEGGLDTVYGGIGDDFVNVTGGNKSTFADGESGIDTVRYDNGIKPVHFEHLVKTVIVTGNVFTDTNKNGVRDGSEKGRAGVQVWEDLNHSGTFDAGDLAVVTDANGNYTFHDVDYGPDIYMNVLPPVGYHQTNNGGKTVKFGATSGSTKSGVNFGLHAN